MQRLMFESSWDKALSANDREKIQRVFLQTYVTNNKRIQFSRLWQAQNHRGELLVTVLIHNFNEHVHVFKDTKLRYVANEQVMAEHTYSLPTLTLEPETSMPWTFIFPTGRFKQDLIVEGDLELIC